MTDRNIISLTRWANDYKNEFGSEELHLALDCKIVKTAFLVMEYCMYLKDKKGNILDHRENCFDLICSSKFNLMAFLYSYPALVNRKKIIPLVNVSKEYRQQLINELDGWPKTWKQFYDHEKMIIIVYVVAHIAESISTCIEEKKIYQLEIN